MTAPLEAHIFVAGEHESTISLLESEISGFEKGFEACKKAAGGGTELVSYEIVRVEASPTTDGDCP